MCVYMCVCTFSFLTYPERYIQEIPLFLFIRHCSHIFHIQVGRNHVCSCIRLIRSYILCIRLSLYLFKEKGYLKRQDSNLESLNYESGILPIQPTLFKKHTDI